MSFPFHLPLILDGATGTNLIAAGMPSGVCVEQWILEHPEKLLALQRAFLEAGSNAVMAPTFGANREKLAAYGLQDQVEEINLKLVALSKEAAEPFHALVGGDVSPAGVMIEPYGDLTFDELYDIYLEQIRALKKAGVDFIALETQMSLADLRAGVLAAKEAGLPVFATITVEDNGRTIMGTKFLPVLITLQALGAAAVGLNCSTGPEVMEELLEGAVSHAQVPLIAKPNAGKPSQEDPAVYPLSPAEFAEKMASFWLRRPNRRRLLRLYAGAYQGACPNSGKYLPGACSPGTGPFRRCDRKRKLFPWRRYLSQRAFGMQLRSWRRFDRH